MGMFNEISDCCHDCGGRGYAQIAQVALGFGNFDLADPQGLVARVETGELAPQDLVRLADLVAAQPVRCEDCGHSWTPSATVLRTLRGERSPVRPPTWSRG